MKPYQIISLPGLTSFKEVEAIQQELLSQRIRDEIPDSLIFCEHTPVITRGRGLQRIEGREARAMPLLNISEGTDYLEISRGGDLTWHGPGQIVLYPIVKLGGDGLIGQTIGQDVNRYIRFLETIMMSLLSQFEIEAASKEGGSGVWVGPKKIASVGIALRRWTSYHGIALNVVNDLRPFLAFDPCGFNAEVMTKVELDPRVPRALLGEDWRTQWESLINLSIQRTILSKV